MTVFSRTHALLLLLCAAVALCAAPVFAQEQPVAAAAPAEINDSLAASDNVTLDFKDADIHNVLKILAKKANINIVATPDVMGTISIKLADVPWDRALDVILKSNGFGYQKQGNVVLVTKLENMSKIQAEEPLRTEIIHLKFLDAQDAQRILISMLSPRGKISILYTRGQKGWKFGSFKIGQDEVTSRMQEREAEQVKSETVSIEKNAAGAPVPTKIEYEPSIKSKTLLVTDTDAVLDRIMNVVLPQIDRKPKQVLIEARIMEVNKDRLKDIGFDYATGLPGLNSASGTTLTSIATDTNAAGSTLSSIAANSLGAQVTPSTFGPKATGIKGTAAGPLNTGLNVLFQKLSGTQFEVMLHALEEDVNTNTLSAPRILTLDNQEAAMLVGYHTPILESTVTSDTAGNSTLAQTLAYYQEIGIRLNVVPQISDEGYINMIIHPSVTSSSSNINAVQFSGSLEANTTYPVIDVREAQTQILMRDGETIVIGGLLKDIKSKSVIGIPFLSKIPFLGVFFRRDTYDVSKVDLLIFITAHVMKDDEFTPAEISRLEERIADPVKSAQREAREAKAKKAKNKKK